MDRTLATRTWLTEHHPTPTPEPSTPIELRAARERLQELDALFATAPRDQRRIIDAVLRSDLNIEDKTQALQAAGAGQQARRDWILEHWPNVVEHHELTDISDQADALHHWPQPLPPAVQAALDEVQATMIDTPETATIGEIEAAIEQHNPHHTLRHLTNQRAPLERQLLALRTTRDDPDLPAPAIEQHIDRLHERLNDLDNRIEQTETNVTLWDWGQNINPDLSDALQRRANHLAHSAVRHRSPWIKILVRGLSGSDESIDARTLCETIIEVAAYRERAGIEVDAPLGHTPATPELVAQYERLQGFMSQLTPIDVSDRTVGISL
jgi:hypothetical protein